MSKFETRQNLYHWQAEVTAIITRLETLSEITVDESNITVAEHKHLLDALSNLDAFMEGFNELEQRKMRGNFHLDFDNDL
jgi:hypothetical protein